MTKITVDKQTALRAMYKYFGIPLFGTGDVYYRTNSQSEQCGVEIEFDFECKHPEINADMTSMTDMTGIPIVYDDREPSKIIVPYFSTEG